MSSLESDFSGQLIASCQAGLAAAQGALATVLNAEVELSLGEVRALDTSDLPAQMRGKGLVLVWKFVGGDGLLGLLSDPQGLLAVDYAQPDPEAKYRLQALVEQIGSALLPAEQPASQSQVAWLDELSEAIDRGQVTSEASLLPITLSGPSAETTLTLVWPVPAPDAILSELTEPELEVAAPEPASTSEAPAPAAAVEPPPLSQPIHAPPVPPRRRLPRDIDEALDELPSYTRSLLKIKVPLVVTLAAAKQPLTKILTLVPGTLLQFDKSCEEPLTLGIGQNELATGEAVKVGEKFGLRLTAITLPQEKLVAIRRAR